MTEEHVQMKDKTPEEELSEEEIGNLAEKEFREIIVQMIKELRRRMDALKKLEVKELRRRMDAQKKLEVFNKEF